MVQVCLLPITLKITRASQPQFGNRVRGRKTTPANRINVLSAYVKLKLPTFRTSLPNGNWVFLWE